MAKARPRASVEGSSNSPRAAPPSSTCRPSTAGSTPRGCGRSLPASSQSSPGISSDGEGDLARLRALGRRSAARASGSYGLARVMPSNSVEVGVLQRRPRRRRRATSKRDRSPRRRRGRRRWPGPSSKSLRPWPPGPRGRRRPARRGTRSCRGCRRRPGPPNSSSSMSMPRVLSKPGRLEVLPEVAADRAGDAADHDDGDAPRRPTTRFRLRKHHEPRRANTGDLRGEHGSGRPAVVRRRRAQSMTTV